MIVIKIFSYTWNDCCQIRVIPFEEDGIVGKRTALLLLLTFSVGIAVFAEEVVGTEALVGAIDMLWLIITGALVFFMQAGFAFVETGLTRVKNATNILMKNLMDFCFGSIVFWMIGWGSCTGRTSSGALSGSATSSRGRWATRPFIGTGFSRWSLRLPRRLSSPAPWPNGPSSNRTLFTRCSSPP